MTKVLTVIGARPQFVKSAAVSRVFAQRSGLEEVVVHTGQHFDQNMSDIFFTEMSIPKPHYHLDINSLGHGAMTGRMLEGIEKIMLSEKPDVLMVFGDTNSTIAGALAARKLDIPVAHVEAGLRSFNMKMPEEINRILTDRISNFLFCPTETAIEHLQLEGFDHFDCIVQNVGDVMYDAAQFYAAQAGEKSNIVADLGLEANGYVLTTVHRQENTDNPENLQSIIAGLNKINRTTRVVFPMHPRTRKILAERGIQLDFEPIDPVGYFDIVQLLENCAAVVTDSGGLQKEAFFFDKFCITAREQTEWTELIENGFNVLVGADGNQMVAAYNNLPQQQADFSMQLYGDGKASEKIADALQGL